MAPTIARRCLGIDLEHKHDWESCGRRAAGPAEVAFPAVMRFKVQFAEILKKPPMCAVAYLNLGPIQSTIL